MRLVGNQVPYVGKVEHNRTYVLLNFQTLLSVFYLRIGIYE